MGDGADLVLQHQQVARPEIREYLIGKGRCNLLICAAVQQDAVLAGGIHLDHGMPAAAVHFTDISGIHAAVREHFPQFAAVRADAARMPHLRARAASAKDWLSPLPPQNVSSFEEASVSPGRTAWATLYTRSRLSEPKFSTLILSCPFVTIMYAV